MTDTTATKMWGGTWLNPPPAWSVESGGILHATSGDRTDFWQETHYGFRRDNGHALLQAVEGAFTATLTFDGDYDALYDQAGLMLRAGPRAWIKFGIEQTDGIAHLSVVATYAGRSDWSAQPIRLNGPVTLRATRLGDALLLQWCPDSGGAHWHMVRLAPVPSGDGAESTPLRAGPYICAPERSGFTARFHHLSIAAPAVGGLHE